MIFLLVWLISAIFSCTFIGAALRSEMNKAPKGGSINGDGYVFMVVLSVIFGPLMTAFLIGVTFTGKNKNESKNNKRS